MSAVQVVNCLVLAAVLTGAAGDRAASQPPAAIARPAGVPLPPILPPTVLPAFTLFGWVSPPVESTTAARIDELAALSLNAAMPAWDDSGRLQDNRQRLSFAAPNGLRCLTWDRRLVDLDFSGTTWGATLDSVVADYRSDPAHFGYYFTDEPAPAEFPLLADFFRELAVRDPAHPCFNNLLGRAGFTSHAAWETYTRQYLDTVHPVVLCNDQYDFLANGDRGQFVENAAALRALANEYGIPFWAIVQLVQHQGYRGLTPGELRWQVSMLLAYGARGVGYFTYWTPAPNAQFNWQPAVIGWDGVRTSWYGMLQQFNPTVRAAGEALAQVSWVSTQHAGSVPNGGDAFAADDWIAAVEGRAAIGRFTDGGGSRYLLVVNPDSLSARTIGLVLARPVQVWRLGSTAGSWSSVSGSGLPAGSRVDLALESGGFALLRLDGRPYATPSGPTLAISPNPARCAVRFAIGRLGSRARLEIHDAAGRLVWSRLVEPTAASLAWNGERDGGGVAAPGLYVVSVRDATGSVSTRVSWLGRP